MLRITYFSRNKMNQVLNIVFNKVIGFKDSFLSRIRVFEYFRINPFKAFPLPSHSFFFFFWRNYRNWVVTRAQGI